MTPCAAREAQGVQAAPAWRKAKEWRRQLKNGERTASQVEYRGGPNKEARMKRAGREYLTVGRVSTKVRESLSSLCDQPVEPAHWEAPASFHRRLDKHLDLVERRLLQEEKIPAHEKVFSLIQPVPGRGPGRLPAPGGLRRDELQPAQERRGTAGTSGHLKPPERTPPAQADSSGVAGGGGEF